MIKHLSSLFRYAWLMPILLYCRWRQPHNWSIALAIDDVHLNAFDPNWKEKLHKANIKSIVEKTSPEAVEAWEKIYP